MQQLGCVARALLGALLTAAQVLGGYAPFAVAAVAAAGPGWEGLGALVETGLGARALLDFPHAQIEQDIAAAEIC